MVDYITYEGKQLPVKISFSALNAFEKETGLTMSQIGEELKNHEIILWHALRAGHYKAKEELTIKREDVEWILDECLGQYQRIFMDSMVRIQDELTGNVDTKKKK